MSGISPDIQGFGVVPRRWWQEVPDDLFFATPDSPIDTLFPRSVRVAAGLDVIARSVLGSVVGAGLRISLRHERLLLKDIGGLDFYRGMVNQGRPDALFQAPGSEGPIAIKSLTPSLISRQKVQRYDLSFRSDFEPLNPAMATAYSRYRRNTFSSARYWRHPGEPRPVLVFSHGYFISAHYLNAAMFQLKWFYSHGFNIVQFTLPFHGVRRESSALFSGSSFMANGFSMMNEAIYQAVHDLRTLIQYLKAEDAPAVGVSGLSLGGYVSSAAASVDDGIAFCIPNASPVSPIDVLAGWWPAGRYIRTLLDRQGLDLAFLRHAFAGHNALTWPSRIGNERHAIVAGAGDRFVPPEFPRLLSEHWGNAPIHWFPGNHLVHLGQSRYNRKILEFMKDQCGVH